jgi:hypothetical protein
MASGQDKGVVPASHVYHGHCPSRRPARGNEANGEAWFSNLAGKVCRKRRWPAPASDLSIYYCRLSYNRNGDSRQCGYAVVCASFGANEPSLTNAGRLIDRSLDRSAHRQGQSHATHQNGISRAYLREQTAGKRARSPRGIQVYEAGEIQGDRERA